MMSNQKFNASPKQSKLRPSTVEEKMNKRDVFVFSKSQGTLKCAENNQEIKLVSFGPKKLGDKIRTYKVPFTENQAYEICNEFNHTFMRSRN